MNKFCLYATLAWLLLCQSACVTYHRYALPQARLPKVNRPEFVYYLVDAAHPLTRVWYMSGRQFNENSITCHLTQMEAMEAEEVVKVHSRYDARMKKNDVLFYAAPRFAANLTQSGTYTIDFKEFERIDVFEIDQIKSIVVPLFSVTGFLSALYLLEN